MNTLFWYILCLILIVWSINTTIRDTLERRCIDNAVTKTLYYFSIFITFFYMIINLDSIYLNLLKFTSGYMKISNVSKGIGLTCIFFVIQIFVYKVLCFSSKPFIKGYGKFFNKMKSGMILMASIFGFLKGLVLILVILLGIVTLNMTIFDGREARLLDKINAYTNIEKIVRLNKEEISHEELEEYIPSGSNVIVYYNGVTLEDGIRSSKDIDNKAQEIVLNAINDREKAKGIYAWIGSNIEYDYEKAEKVLNNDKINNSGALEAWKTNKGICFDYACLYVAMCREVGLKVRLITGKAYDGKEYVPHAWNEVYLEDEGRWVDVDPTFYLAGDNFDSEWFEVEHRKESTAGEW